MFTMELPSERDARTNLQKCRDKETERQKRIFNDKLRTIGIDKDALDSQMKEKKKREAAAKEEQHSYDADMLRDSKAACLFHSREVKLRRAMQKAAADHRHERQQLCCQCEFDLEDPACCGETDFPGLVGEDLDSKSRQQRQKEQLRQWLLQQQSERAAERQQQKLEAQRYDQGSAEMHNKALQLQDIEMEKRKAATIATKEYNLALIEEKLCQQAERNDESNQTATVNHQLTGVGAETELTAGMLGVPGPSTHRKAPPESLQQIIQFHKYQIEEKKKAELERKRDEEQHDRIRLESSRAALLIERQQAKLNKQLRQQMDSTNVQMAETHEKPNIQRECLDDDSFFSKFNTCSR
ncbi:RIB43A-like with coiled-coils protein 2 [Clinocottus analis]|uniref:RIB43A-like with coiled-coils protein 2 n=1 Tax=Clinocottus analis TaxID=304258 RepID=UPI0035BFFA24